jgi:prepilin-type N-terminal cleavage/methylation domain-containing protein/prepilin-type processing-associated H-X9-DG protein
MQPLHWKGARARPAGSLWLVPPDPRRRALPARDLRWRFGRWPRLDPRYHCARVRPGVTLLELLVVIGIIAVLVALLVPMVTRVRNRSGGSANTVKCHDQLRALGQALLLYANENKGAFPRTIYVPDQPLNAQDDGENGGSARDPFGLSGPTASPYRRDNDVAAAIFLLIRTQDIATEIFVCPSSDAEKDTFGGSGTPAPGATSQNKVSFSSWRKNLSYSYANPYPSAEAAKRGYSLDTKCGAEFAVAADLNPGIGDGYDVTAPLDETASQKLMLKANSQNHRGAGQNVLFGDGHVDFVQNPFCGVQRDNIYTVSGSTDGSKTTSKVVVGSPVGPHDSVLLPALK